MKFVPLKSRGGDYLVVAANIAYLRDDENGQTKVGMPEVTRCSSSEA